MSRANPRAYLEVLRARTSRYASGTGAAVPPRTATEQRDSDGFRSAPPLLLLDGGVILQRAGEEPAILRGVDELRMRKDERCKARNWP
jgi:hypothetical protein